MYCRNCGKEIADDNNFCPRCGARLKNTIEERNEYRRYDETRRENNDQFYKQTWFGILMLFVFWPIGLYLLIKYGGSITRFIFSIVAGFIAFIFFGMMFLGCGLGALLLDDMPMDNGVPPKVEQRQDDSFSSKVLDEMRKASVPM